MYLKDIIAEIIRQGNVERFFPMFYNCVQETGGLFPRLSRDASLFLRFDFANHIVAFLSHSYFHKEESGFESMFPDISAADFNQKERDIICYLSGYVFGTLSRRIKNSKHWNSQVNEENVKVLLAGKTENTTI